MQFNDLWVKCYFFNLCETSMTIMLRTPWCEFNLLQIEGSCIYCNNINTAIIHEETICFCVMLKILQKFLPYTTNSGIVTQLINRCKLSRGWLSLMVTWSRFKKKMTPLKMISFHKNNGLVINILFSFRILDDSSKLESIEM